MGFNTNYTEDVLICKDKLWVKIIGLFLCTIMEIVCFVSHFGLCQFITGKFVRTMFARGEKETFIIFKIFSNGSLDFCLIGNTA